jgi:DNA-binding FadR family transcriptional regulator
MVRGNLRPGDPLPSERVLADRLNVGRGVVREAIRDLIARGFVATKHGSGLRVAPGRSSLAIEQLPVGESGETSPTVLEVQDVRRLIELPIVEAAARRAGEADISRLRDAVEWHRESSEAEDYASAALADLQFHRILAAMTGNPVYGAIFDALRDVLLELRHVMMRMPGYAEKGLREHERILEAVAAGNPEAARKEMAFHLENAEPEWYSVHDRRLGERSA